jgi:hypothetical protein
LQEQLERLFTTRLSWQFSKDFRSCERGQGSIATSNLARDLFRAVLPKMPPTWRPKVVLSDDIFQEFTRSAVPVDLRAVHQLRHSPLALDIYSWLTYRMRYLRKPCLISWESLQAQFGADYGRLRDFRRKFLAHMAEVISVYPRVRLTKTTSGLLLKPSRTHIKRTN